MPGQRKLTTMMVLWIIFLGIAGCAGVQTPTDPAANTIISNSTAVPAKQPATIQSIADQQIVESSSSTAIPKTPATENSTETTSDYRIGPQDLLKIEVFGVADLNRAVRVNARGQIALPLIGSVRAGGLTAEELAADIAARLAKDYLQNPQVTIFIEEFTSQRATVVGAVKTPGVYPLKGRITLMQVVASAGGTTSVSSDKAAVLRPEADGTRKMLQYDLEAIRDGQAPDPEVHGEDIVHVETSGFKSTAKEIMEFVLPFRLVVP